MFGQMGHLTRRPICCPAATAWRSRLGHQKKFLNVQAEEAKHDLREIVNYLREPEKYSRLGGRLPKGVLLVGSPGTGKTLLARAVAGEASVAFFSSSGPEFEEVFVGQGVKRVRDLFAAAKAQAPCVVFIDEIDSVGRKRSSSSALHPYANQTINQLLTEIDGFEKNEGIIVIGATNRRMDLDVALLRPGRFDIIVDIPLPDLKGRIDIYTLYLNKIVQSDDVDLLSLAQRSIGFTGAQIENLVNQAALQAASEGSESVGQQHLNDAYDRIVMGRERKAGRLPDEECNKNTAYHEAGHTLVAFHTKHAKKIHKCTILPRGGSLGHTALQPTDEQYSITRAQLLAQMDTLMGGRVAEELIFGIDNVTTGAGNDLSRATETAYQMVKMYGMSDKAGLRDYTVRGQDNEAALIQSGNDLSPATVELLDNEIKRLLQESYDRAKTILRTHARAHHALAEALLEHETLSAEEIEQVIKGEKLKSSFAGIVKAQKQQQKDADEKQQSEKKSSKTTPTNKIKQPTRV